MLRRSLTFNEEHQEVTELYKDQQIPEGVFSFTLQ